MNATPTAGGLAAGLLLGASTVLCAAAVIDLVGTLERGRPGAAVVGQPSRAGLQQKARLVLAVSAPDYPPFEYQYGDHTFEGLTADYAESAAHNCLQVGDRSPTLSRREKTPFEPSNKGRADLLGTSNSYESQDRQLQMSQRLRGGSAGAGHAYRFPPGTGPDAGRQAPGNAVPLFA